MPNLIRFIRIEIRSDENGDFLLDGNKAHYSMGDSNNPRMIAGGEIVLDPINPNDTFSEWNQKVKNQISAKDVVDNAAFLAEIS